MPVTPEYKINLVRQMRQAPTPSENRLWTRIRNHQVDGLGFRRQRPIGRYVADFVCEGVKLVVEVDGGYHDTAEQRELDVEREAHFTGRGYVVMRVSADEVMRDLEAVIYRIQGAASEKWMVDASRVNGRAVGSPHPARSGSPPSPVPGEGSPLETTSPAQYTNAIPETLPIDANPLPERGRVASLSEPGGGCLPFNGKAHH